MPATVSARRRGRDQGVTFIFSSGAVRTKEDGGRRGACSLREGARVGGISRVEAAGGPAGESCCAPGPGRAPTTTAPQTLGSDPRPAGPRVPPGSPLLSPAPAWPPGHPCGWLLRLPSFHVFDASLIIATKSHQKPRREGTAAGAGPRGDQWRVGCLPRKRLGLCPPLSWLRNLGAYWSSLFWSNSWPVK